MKRVLTQLDKIHAKLLDAITPLDDEKFARRPSENQWSVAEVVHHLCLVEQRVLEGLKHELSQPPKRVGLRYRLVPYSLLVGRRVRRVKAPQAVEPLDAPAKETVIENYNRLRQTIKTLGEEQGRRRLSQVVMKHPILGDFSGVKAIAFVGYHERRHYKQIQEIIRQL